MKPYKILYIKDGRYADKNEGSITSAFRRLQESTDAVAEATEKLKFALYALKTNLIIVQKQIELHSGNALNHRPNTNKGEDLEC